MATARNILILPVTFKGKGPGMKVGRESKRGEGEKMQREEYCGNYGANASEMKAPRERERV
jgi:hypothetical protein